MKIAIHQNPGGFSDRWIDYCEKNHIDYKIVNAYDTDIVQQMSDCDAFMWHFSHLSYKDALFAKQLLFSLQQAGKKVFPDFDTVWHFDDKVGQKYLLEAIGAPLVPSYVFYTKQEAFKWIEQTSFPKVFKLRGGAGASNVKLVRTKRAAVRLVKKAFGKGFPQYDAVENIQERWRKYRLGKTGFQDVIKGVIRFFHKPDFAKMHAPEKGYAYFQEFIPNNTTDYRVKVVCGNCWAFQRVVRNNDFRASGSGTLLFDNSQIPQEMVECAQKTAQKLNLQSVAFDFIHDKINNEFLIVEMSYGFGFDDNEMHNGYWDSKGRFHKELFNPFDWMVEGIVKGIV